MFIVQCRPPTPDGAAKINAATRKAAMEAANDFLNLEMPFVTISADGQVYSVEEFAKTMAGVSLIRKEGEVPSQWAELQQLDEMAGEMVVTAFKLSPGVERHDSLMLIDGFRKRITTMKRSGLEAMRTRV